MTESSRGRPATVELDAVVDAALRIIDAHGIDALTMRRLAKDLGVSPMAPYRVVRSKEELLRLAAAFVVSDIPPPAEGADWRIVVIDFFSELFDRFTRYPGVARLYGSDTFLTEPVYAATEPVFAALLGAGFSPDEAVSVFMACGSTVIGGALLSSGLSDDDSAVVVLSTAKYPSVAKVLQELPSRAARERIMAGLEHVIRGYERS